jgi:hypothetical protein
LNPDNPFDDDEFGKRTLSVMVNSQGRRISKIEQRVDDQQSKIEQIQADADAPDAHPQEAPKEATPND